jgi:hypothetical protein
LEDHSNTTKIYCNIYKYNELYYKFIENTMENTTNIMKCIINILKNIEKTFKYTSVFLNISIDYLYTINIDPYILVYVKIPFKYITTPSKNLTYL